MFRDIPPIVYQFVLTLVFSFTLGLEQRKLHPEDHEKLTFGTDRTFAFIGLLGLLLLKSILFQPYLYVLGATALIVFLSIFYFQKIKFQQAYGLTTILLALLTYFIPLVVVTQPQWFSILFFVVLLLLSESKKKMGGFSKRIEISEFITLAKFLIIAGVVLPILPNNQISTFFNFSPYKIWLAIVVISGISYLSYLLRKFVFPKAGVLLTGLLGGLYSSTATTLILARKSKQSDINSKAYASAILLATSMMFLRIYIFILVFNANLGTLVTPYFISLFVVSLIVAYFTYAGGFVKINFRNEVQSVELEENNPLEFKVAIIFASMYVLFSIITQYIITQFGDSGLTIMSIIVGFTDIDPFLLNLFQGKYDIKSLVVLIATLQAILSNNILKLVYAKLFGNAEMTNYLLKGFGVILILNLIFIIILHFY
jgi:uncharacterized membrane protein (DUF4010 family)